MLETVKKTIQASVGAVVLTRERVRQTLDRLVQEGKLSTEEAERIADRIIRDGKKELKGLEEKMVSLMQKGLRNLDFVSKEEFEALKERVDALENRKKTGEATRAKKRRKT